MIQASVVIPTYNEASNLPLLLAEIESVIDRTWLDVEYIIVDDNSPDGTGAVADALAEKYPVRVIHRSGKQGLGSAVRAGFAASDRPYIAVMDADLSHDPAIIPTLFEDLSHADIAIGSRFAEGSKVENWQLGRKMLSHVGVAMARRITGVTDPLSGFFAFKRAVIEQKNLTTTGYKILLEILVKGVYTNVTEHAFNFRMRRHSTSKLNLQEYWFFAQQLVWYGLIKWWRGVVANWPVVTVGLAVVTGALITANYQSVWLDEGLSWEFAQKSPDWLVNLARTTDLHPPLYNLFLHTIGQVSFSAFWLRGWSVVWYALLLWVLWRSSIKPLILNRAGKTAIFAVVATIPFAVFYASELRSYAAVMLVGALQFLAFDRACQKQNGSRWWYALWSLIGLNLFYPFGFVLVAQAAYVVVRQRAIFSHLFWPWVVITVTYAPWLVSVVLNRLNEQPGHFLAIPWWQIPAVVALGFAGGRVSVTDINHLHHYWPTAVAAVAQVLTMVGMWWWRRERDTGRLERVLWVALGTMGLCLLISATRFSIFDPRYYAHIFPLYALIVVYGLQAWWRHGGRMGQWVVGVILVAQLVVNGLYWFNPWYQREAWKKVVAELETQLQSGDAVVFIGKFQPPPTYAIYQTKPAQVVGVYPNDLADISNSDAISVHLHVSLVDAKRVWYSQFLEWQKDPTGKWRTVLEQMGFTKVKTIGFFKVQFDLYERR